MLVTLAMPFVALCVKFGYEKSNHGGGRLDILLTGLYLCILLILLAFVAYMTRSRTLFYVTAACLILTAYIFEKPYFIGKLDCNAEALRMFKILTTVGVALSYLLIWLQHRNPSGRRNFSLMEILGLTTLTAIMLAIWSLDAG